MKYNKTKRGLELGAALTALVYCAIDLIFEIIAFVDIVKVIDYFRSFYGDDYKKYMNEATTALLMGTIIGITLVIIELVFACKLLKKPEQTENGFKNMKKIRITFLIFSSILAAVFLCGISTGFSEVGIGILAFLIFATVIVLESIAMSMKDVKVEGQAKKEVIVTTNLSIEQKIAELKHLKELGVIDEEQYKNAVEKNIKEIM